MFNRLVKTAGFRGMFTAIAAGAAAMATPAYADEIAASSTTSTVADQIRFDSIDVAQARIESMATVIHQTCITKDMADMCDAAAIKYGTKFWPVYAGRFANNDAPVNDNIRFVLAKLPKEQPKIAYAPLPEDTQVTAPTVAPVATATPADKPLQTIELPPSNAAQLSAAVPKSTLPTTTAATAATPSHTKPKLVILPLDWKLAPSPAAPAKDASVKTAPAPVPDDLLKLVGGIDGVGSGHVMAPASIPDKDLVLPVPEHNSLQDEIPTISPAIIAPTPVADVKPLVIQHRLTVKHTASVKPQASAKPVVTTTVRSAKPVVTTTVRTAKPVVAKPVPVTTKPVTTQTTQVTTKAGNTDQKALKDIQTRLAAAKKVAQDKAVKTANDLKAAQDLKASQDAQQALEKCNKGIADAKARAEWRQGLMNSASRLFDRYRVPAGLTLLAIFGVWTALRFRKNKQNENTPVEKNLNVQEIIRRARVELTEQLAGQENGAKENNFNPIAAVRRGFTWLGEQVGKIPFDPRFMITYPYVIGSTESMMTGMHAHSGMSAQEKPFELTEKVRTPKFVTMGYDAAVKGMSVMNDMWNSVKARAVKIDWRNAAKEFAINGAIGVTTSTLVKTVILSTAGVSVASSLPAIMAVGSLSAIAIKIISNKRKNQKWNDEILKAAGFGLVGGAVGSWVGGIVQHSLSASDGWLNHIFYGTPADAHTVAQTAVHTVAPTTAPAIDAAQTEKAASAIAKMKEASFHLLKEHRYHSKSAHKAFEMITNALDMARTNNVHNKVVDALTRDYNFLKPKLG